MNISKILVTFLFTIFFFQLLCLPAVAAIQPNLNTYSLSIAKINNWWPTPDNTVQQFDAALWKDNDGTNIKNFKNLKAEWKFDPAYYQIKDTSYHYHSECPQPEINQRACIIFSAHIVTLKPGKTSVQLTIKNDQGQETWNSSSAMIENQSPATLSPTPIKLNLASYSLSFQSDPIRNWWSAPSNQYQDITAAIWKDNSGQELTQFKDLIAEWQLDPQYYEVGYTSSRYFNQCPLTNVQPRPCIYFYASVRPLQPGNTTVQLKVTDTNGGEVWNAYPAIIDDVSQPVTPSVAPSIKPDLTITPTIAVVQLPANSDYQELEQKVKLLENEVREQNIEINRFKILLDNIVSFLKKIFKFGS